MKQIQIEYKNTEILKFELAKVIKSRKTMPYSAVVFQIYAGKADVSEVESIIDIIDLTIPDALYYGSEVYAGMSEGVYTENAIIIVCNIFESESTKYKLYLADEKSELVDMSVPNSLLKNVVKENPWAKSVELISSIYGAATLLSDKEELNFDSEITVFGSIACDPQDVSGENTFVFAKGFGFSGTGIVVFVCGGEDLSVESTYSVGWRSLGKHMTITDCDGRYLKTIDDIPVLDLYDKYFDITPSSTFSEEIVMFPLLIEKYGVDCLSTPIKSISDGSLLMAAANTEGSLLRFSYGEPGAIINSIRRYGEKIVDFAPDVIRAVSCCGRAIFLGENIGSECQLLDTMAPTSGYYARGQIFLIKNHLFQFTNTLVIIGYREGEKIDYKLDLYEVELDYIDKPFMSRLMNYITVSSQELEDYNERLKEMAITDGMTGLNNRTETQRKITERVQLYEEKKENLYLLMLDIDNFKSVNDTYGHDLGDVVIKELARELKDFEKKVPNTFAGRWGGEEFMFCVAGASEEEILQLAENMRKGFSEVSFEKVGNKTISIGLVKYAASETVTSFCKRVDDALYEAKNTGKNRVVFLR